MAVTVSLADPKAVAVVTGTVVRVDWSGVGNGAEIRPDVDLRVYAAGTDGGAGSGDWFPIRANESYRWPVAGSIYLQAESSAGTARIRSSPGPPGTVIPAPSSSTSAPASGALGPEIGFAALTPANAGALPAATTVLFGGATFATDLTTFDQARLVRQMGTAGPVGSLLGVRASLDGGSSWVWPDDGTAASGDLGSHGPQLAIDATGEARSGWTALHASVRGPVLVQFVSDNGNGVAQPTIRRAQVQGGVA